MKYIITALLLIAGKPALLGQEAAGNSTTFIVPYPPVYFDNQMRVYLCTGSRAANITATIYTSNSSTTKMYRVAANSTLQLPDIPFEMRITERFSDSQDTVWKRTLRIHSDVPVTGYVHYEEDEASAGMQLLPVRSWGYDYKVMDVPNNQGGYICVVAAFNNTKVEITPNVPTKNKHAADVPFVIMLNKGEVYMMRPAGTADQFERMETTGTLIKAVANSFGISYPVGVYDGTSGLALTSNPDKWVRGSADFEAEQMSPVCSWGERFLTAPFAINSSANGSKVNNALFRIMVKDPATIVKKNNVQLTPLIKNAYYEYISGEADYLEASAPVMVTQNMLAMAEPDYPVSGSCDGEMMVISPMEDAGRRSDFYLPKRVDQDYNFISLCIPTNGLTSLKINGNNNFSYTYPHPNKPGYTVVVKKSDAQGAYCTAQSDSAFTGITYSLPAQEGKAESVGSNITGVFYPEGDVLLTNKGTGGVMKNIVCLGDSFRLSLKTEYLPLKIEWFLKNYPGLFPNNQNVVLQNPVPDSTITRDEHVYHYFSIPQYYTVKQINEYAIPVVITSPAVRNCTQTQTYITEWYAAGKKPVPDFAYVSKGCVPFDVRFTAGVVAGDTSVVTACNWDFGDGQETTNPTHHIYQTQGDKQVYLQVTGRNTCVGDTVKMIRLTDAVRPVAAFRLPVVACIPNAPATFVNQSTYAGTEPGNLTWQWDFDDNTKSVVKDPMYAYSVLHSYTVQLIVTASDGCSDTTEQELTAVFERPKAGFSMSATRLCVGDTLRLTDESVPVTGRNLTQWNWEFGDRTFSVLQHPVKVYTQRGIMQLSLFAVSEEGCSSDTAYNTIQVYEVPQVEAGPDQLILEGIATRLQGAVQVVGNVVLQWSPAVSLSDLSIATPLARPQADQLYYLTATASNLCSAYDSVWVRVLPYLVVPTAFSPNNDGYHDVWKIPGIEVYPAAVVQVFNRYGQKVFESKGYNMQWDGTWQNKPLPPGTYYYVLHPGEDKSVQAGPLTILR